MATFLKNVHLVSRASTQFLDGRLGVEGLCGYHCKYLLTVCHNPGLTQDKIAKIMFVNKSNVARQIGYLAEQGFIERVKSNDDGRAYLVYPTQKALQALPLIREANAEWRKSITEGFTEEEVELLSSLTARLVQNAQKFLEGDGD